MPPTNRPGASRWSGSNWSLTRRIRSSAATGPQTSTAALTAAGRRPRRRCRRRGCRSRGPAHGGCDRLARRAGRAARRTRRRRRPSRARAGPCSRGGGEHVGESGEREGELQAGGAVVAGGRRVPGVRRSARRVVRPTRSPRRRAGAPTVAARPSTPSSRPSSSTCTAPCPSRGHSTSIAAGTAWPCSTAWTTAWACAGSATGVLTQRLRHGHGVQPEDGLGDDGEGAERADQQLAEVVAGDVLDDPAAGLGDHAVGTHHGDADEQVAGGAGGDAARPAGVGGQRAPDAGAGHGLVEREALAALGHGLLQVGEPRARLGDDDQVAGSVLEHLVERADVEQHVGARRAAGPTTAWCRGRAARR